MAEYIDEVALRVNRVVRLLMLLHPDKDAPEDADEWLKYMLDRGEQVNDNVRAAFGLDD